MNLQILMLILRMTGEKKLFSIYIKSMDVIGQELWQVLLPIVLEVRFEMLVRR